MRVRSYNGKPADLIFQYEHYLSRDEIDESERDSFDEGNEVEVSIEVDVDVNDVLNTLTIQNIADHLESRTALDERSAIAAIKSEYMMDYLVDEYHRGSFSDFDFEKLFDKIGVKM
jgi:hypothetical protein